MHVTAHCCWDIRRTVCKATRRPEGNINAKIHGVCTPKLVASSPNGLLTGLPDQRWALHRLRAKREQCKRFQVRLPVSQGQNLTLTVLYVPCWLNRGSSALLLRRTSTDRAHTSSYPATSPQSGSISSSPIILLCTTRRRIPASASANQGSNNGDLIRL